jgi:hypothetical protein
MVLPVGKCPNAATPQIAKQIESGNVHSPPTKLFFAVFQRKEPAVKCSSSSARARLSRLGHRYLATGFAGVLTFSLSFFANVFLPTNFHF